jgi:DNA-binding transcriptional regulator GbsR (MarR family)
MKTLILFFSSFFSLSLAMANQDINTQKLELQKKFISNINQCSNPEQLDQFIKNAVKNISNQTERARHAALLEDLIKYNPSCFVATVKKLDNKTCEKIQESYLNEPFFYPREDLRASLATAKDYKASCLAS